MSGQASSPSTSENAVQPSETVVVRGAGPIPTADGNGLNNVPISILNPNKTVEELSRIVINRSVTGIRDELAGRSDASRLVINSVDAYEDSLRNGQRTPSSAAELRSQGALVSRFRSAVSDAAGGGSAGAAANGALRGVTEEIGNDTAGNHRDVIKNFSDRDIPGFEHRQITIQDRNGNPVTVDIYVDASNALQAGNSPRIFVQSDADRGSISNNDPRIRDQVRELEQLARDEMTAFAEEGQYNLPSERNKMIEDYTYMLKMENNRIISEDLGQRLASGTLSQSQLQATLRLMRGSNEFSQQEIDYISRQATEHSENLSFERDHRSSMNGVASHLQNGDMVSGIDAFNQIPMNPRILEREIQALINSGVITAEQATILKNEYEIRNDMKSAEEALLSGENSYIASSIYSDLISQGKIEPSRVNQELDRAGITDPQLRQTIIYETDVAVAKSYLASEGGSYAGLRNHLESLGYADPSQIDNIQRNTMAEIFYNRLDNRETYSEDMRSLFEEYGIENPAEQDAIKQRLQEIYIEEQQRYNAETGLEEPINPRNPQGQISYQNQPSNPLRAQPTLAPAL
jgi:hypothetical protein